MIEPSNRLLEMELPLICVKGNKKRKAASPSKEIYSKSPLRSWQDKGQSSTSLASQREIVLRSLLHEAVLSRNLEEIRTTIANSDGNIADQINDKRMSLLHHATKNDFDDVVTLLIENGAKVDLLSADDCTPLHIALRYCHLLLQIHFELRQSYVH